LRGAVVGLTECQKEKAVEVILRQEAEADNRQLRDANKMLAEQNTALQEELTKLRGQVREQ
jgi:hypothetical protein